MEQRSLGMTGLRVSALGFGCGAIGGLMTLGDPAEQNRAVQRALDAGITYFDTAPSYGNGRSEENLGRALRELGAWQRVVVGTKVRLELGDLDDPTTAIRRSLEASLRRLGRDSVDLLQLHNHVRLQRSSALGATLSLDDVQGAVADGLAEMVREGLTRHVGFTAMGDAAAVAPVARGGRVETAQCYFSAVNPSAGYAGAAGGEQDFAGLIDVAAGAGLGVIAIRVYAAGALSAREERHLLAGDPSVALAEGGDYRKNLRQAQGLGPLVAELGLESPLELSLRFVLSKPGVSTALVGLSEFGHLESAIRWAERGPLSADVVRRVVETARG